MSSTTETITLEELEDFFISIQLPKTIQLCPGVTVIDVPLFINSHLTILKGNRDRLVYDVFKVRLIRLKELLLSNSDKL